MKWNRDASRTFASLLVSAVGAILLMTAAGGDPPVSGGDAALAKQAASVLGLRCLSCHNPVKKAGGLDLSTRTSALNSHAFVPQNADDSHIVRQVVAGKMPPDARLPDAEVAVLRRWVAAGATYAHEPLVERSNRSSSRSGRFSRYSIPLFHTRVLTLSPPIRSTDFCLLPSTRRD